jgi:type I restriction enzyme S subunit
VEVLSKWDMVRLGDVFPYIRNGANLKQDKNVLGFPITRIESVSGGTINRNKMGYAGIMNLEPYSSFVLQEGDILMSHINSVTHLGKVARYTKQSEEKIIHGMNLLNLRIDDEKATSRFAYYFFTSYGFKEQIPNITKHSVNQSSFNITALKDLWMPLPPLDVQEKIANTLDRAAALIEKRKVQIAKLGLLVKSQFIKMFGDPVINPMGWNSIRLGNIVNVRSSKRVYQREQTLHGVPFLRISDMVRKIMEQKDSCELYILPDLYENFKQNGLIPKENDVLVTSRGTLGLCYIMKDTDRFYFQDGMISWLNKQEDNIDSLYLSYYFQSVEMKRQIKQVSAGSTVGYLSLMNIENFTILLPPRYIQTQFATFVKSTEKSKAEMQCGLAKFELLYKSLMQKCFNGDYIAGSK